MRKILMVFSNFFLCMTIPRRDLDGYGRKQAQFLIKRHVRRRYFDNSYQRTFASISPTTPDSFHSVFSVSMNTIFTFALLAAG